MSHALDPNEAFAGRFFDVYIFESFSIQYMVPTPSSTRVADSINVAFVIDMNYHVGVTNFGDYRANLFIPW
jgi:hypothetical protein